MSTYTIFNHSTSFRLAKGNASEKAINKLIAKHMDDYPVTLERDGEEYTLEFDSADVGDSFPERARNLVNSVGEHVQNPFMIQLRTDSIGDDRDEEIFGGPDPAGVNQFAQDYYLERALDDLRGHGGRYYELLRQVMAGQLVNPKHVKVIVTIEGGNLTGISATHGVQAFKVDYDVEGATEDELVQIPQLGKEATCEAHASAESVNVDVTRCEEIIAAIEGEGQQTERPRQT